MAITSAEAVDRHTAPYQMRRKLCGKMEGETIMINALAFAVVAVALGMPSLIMAAMSARI
jgi:hypothetical protein